MKKIVLLSILPAIFSIFVSGQDSLHRFFDNPEMLQPFLSETRSSAIKVELASLNKLDENYYVSDHAGRPFMEVHLGTTLPLLYLANPQKKIRFSAGGFLGNVLLIDMFEETTAPVINTDYFFGLQAGMLKDLDYRHIKNFGFILIPVFHESTHLGDEFALHGYHDIPGFRRINVSYEAWEIAAVINDPGTIKTNLLSAKAGFQRLWNYAGGYYSADSLETKGNAVAPSLKNYTYFMQLNLQRTKGFLCSPKWMQVFSAEIYNRLKFSYDSPIPEARSWNLNLYLGWEHVSGGAGRNIGFYVRYYHGIIPNGQFRNTDGYRYLALSIVYH